MKISKNLVLNALCFIWLLIISTVFTIKANAGDQFGMPYDPNYTKKTYVYSLKDFIPASGQTHFLTLTGSPSKVIHITKIAVAADSTATGAVDFYYIKNYTADSAGTATRPVPVDYDSSYPLQPTLTTTGFIINQYYVISATSTGCTNMGASANTIGLSFVATAVTPSSGTCIAKQSATAQINLYSANPTVGLNNGYLNTSHYISPNSSTTGVPAPIYAHEYSTRAAQEISLRGANEQFVFSLEGEWVGTPAGLSIDALIEWTEE